MHFSKVLKLERKKQNLTQFELAELLNVSDKTISSWENGRSYPDVIMLKSIAIALKIDVAVLLDAEDFNTEVNNINKEELKENHLKEKKYIRNSIISVFLNITSLLIPIVHLILGNIYDVKLDSSMTQIHNFSEYERISRIVFPLLIICCAILTITSFAIFIISTIEFKKHFIDGNFNVRYKFIIYRYINIYVGTYGIILFLTLTPVYRTLYAMIIIFLSILAIYILISIIISKMLKLTQQYNTIVIVEIVLISVLCVSSIIISILQIPFVILLLLTSIYINSIILLQNKENRREINK